MLDDYILPGMINNEGIWKGFRVYTQFHELYRSYENVTAPPQSGVPKHCFSNAIEYLMQNPNGVYVEGWIVFKEEGIPIEHAWNGDIDATLGARSEDFEYFGLAFDGKFAIEVAHSEWYKGSMLTTLARVTDKKAFVERFGDPFALEDVE